MIRKIGLPGAAFTTREGPARDWPKLSTESSLRHEVVSQPEAQAEAVLAEENSR